MQLRDDEFGQGVDTAGPDRPSGPRHAGRVAGGRRRTRKKVPLPAAVAAVVLLTGAGSAYTVISGEAPARTAATASSSSSDAVGRARWAARRPARPHPPSGPVRRK
ncbi:hypothetical protein MRQ86_28655 [Streptomyces sp. MMS21 TC-5]|uniref:hypothetical protein n=1 Tax=Streptomyces sp. MMS21 TC-5 TaxID=2925833 RepID=UPI001F601520|nr:hypothetical protein [Streptomyces sp. MMS21 TC-5]MCI4084212.1 hypothetical protein [Streptomyces sp. MMS21 TC-5]